MILKYNKNLFSAAKDLLVSSKTEILRNEYIPLEMKYSNFAKQFNKICVYCVYNYLISKVEYSNPLIVFKDELEKKLNIIPEYKKFYIYMLDLLKHNNFLVDKNNLLFFKNIYIDVSEEFAVLKQQYQMFKGTILLLEHCVKYFSSALSGEIPAISVLYPEGNSIFIEEILSLNTQEYSEMPIFSKILQKLLFVIFQNQPLKILEIGGGRGLITREILKNIPNTIEFHFTDISKRFIINMRNYVAKNNLINVKCYQFDITKDPILQGLDLYSYDIIIGLDVVHATPNIIATLTNLKSLLNFRGILCLLETTKVESWQNLIMGFTKGWWLFEDKYRTLTPLLNPSSWENVIKESQFLSYNIMSLDSNKSDVALIIAQ